MFLGRVPAPGEALWLSEDRSWALALMSVEADTHQCGQPLSETLAEENGDAYTVDVRGVCAACYALEAKAKGMPDGMLYTVRKR